MTNAYQLQEPAPFHGTHLEKADWVSRWQPIVDEKVAELFHNVSVDFNRILHQLYPQAHCTFFFIYPGLPHPRFLRRTRKGEDKKIKKTKYEDENYFLN